MKARAVWAGVSSASIALVLAVTGAAPAGAAPLPAPLPVAPASLYASLGTSADWAAWSAEMAADAAMPVTAAAPAALGGGLLLAAPVGFELGAQAVRAFYAVTGGDLGTTLCTSGLGGLVAPAYGVKCPDPPSTITDPDVDVPSGIPVFSSCRLDACLYYDGTVPGKYGTRADQVWCVRITKGGQPYKNAGVAVPVSDGSAGWFTIGVSPDFPTGAYLTGGPQASVTGSCPADDWPFAISVVPMPAITGIAFKTSSGVVQNEPAPAQVPPDPARQLQTTITDTNGQNYSCKSAQFFETSTTIPPVCSPVLPPEAVPGHVAVKEVTPDGSLPAKTVQDQDTSAPYRQVASDYPDCALGACVVQVKTATGLCTVGADACLDWQSDPAEDDVQCVYGPEGNRSEYSLALSECAMLAHYYDPQAQQTGHPYSDPSTGEQIATQTAPSADQSADSMPATADDTPGTDSCFPQGWSAFNPVEWVRLPVQCALRWAFVPDPQAVEDDASSLRQAWAGTPVVTLPAAVSSWNIDPVLTGCDGITVDLSAVWPKAHAGPFQVLAACDGDPLHTTAVLGSGLIGIAVTLAAGYSMMRSVAGVIAFNTGGA